MVKSTSHTLLYTSLLRWEPLVVEGSEGLAWIKTLAKDEETGARTALVKFDPGYKQAKSIGQGAADIYELEGGDGTSGVLPAVPFSFFVGWMKGVSKCARAT